MKRTELIMGMPITAEFVEQVPDDLFERIFTYFRAVDSRFSPYKPTSELRKVNAGLPKSAWSAEMRTVIANCEQTKAVTGGFFDIAHNGQIDPSGYVKGWSIVQAAHLIEASGIRNFYIEAGGDIQASGHNADGSPWSVGIRSPFDIHEIIKVTHLSNRGVATSGTSIRGNHIYNPHTGKPADTAIKSLTVIGPDACEADRFATAAFAMGRVGISFIEQLEGFEGYMVDEASVATYTKGFMAYVG